jgi:hypothetical protein
MPAAPRPKLIFWTIVSFFAVSIVAAAIWSWSLVGGVRSSAALTDARYRELAWIVLAYADQNDGFPISEDELRAFVRDLPAPPEALANKPLASEGRVYPVTRADAGAPATPVPLDEILVSVEVEWPIERDVQPILRPRGLPTLQGTRESVGQWLFAMTERIRAQ